MKKHTKINAIKEIQPQIEKAGELLEAVGDGVIIVDRTFKILYQNQAAKDMMGACVGESCFKVYGRRQGICGGCPVALTFKDGKTHAVQRELQTDKRTKYMEITASPLRDSEGKIIAGIEVVRDITDRRLSEELLKESEQRYRNVYNTAPLAFVLWDKETRVTDWNNRAEQMFGWTREEIVGQNFFDYIIPESACVRVQEIVKLLLEGKLPSHSINENITKSGQIIMCEWNNSIIRDSGGNVVGVISLGLDITERKRSEEKLHRLTEDLKRSNEDLQQFAYIASHDLQAPLRNIKGFAQMLSRRYKSKLDDKADEYINYISEGVQDMQLLIHDLLELSKVERGGKPYSSVDVSRCVNRALLNLRTAVAEKNAKITHDDNLPAVYGDYLQLTSVLQNLIGNAIKFSHERPKVHISSRMEGNRAVFTIKDNGIGMDKKDTKKIFAVFRRLHGKSEYPGTGIGLALCKKIVERHGGRIWVESEPGKGSTFYFTLPVMDTSSRS
jgi:PAS domain S-box-containing protein